MNTEEEPDNDKLKERPNKSALKRESAQLRELGETLLALNTRQLETIPLTPKILQAMDETRGLKHRDARKRQLQFIGKLLGKTNLEEIHSALTKLENSNRFFRQRLKNLENLTETLIAQGDVALSKLLTEHPELNRQQLRQLIRKAQSSSPVRDIPTNNPSSASPDKTIDQPPAVAPAETGFTKEKTNPKTDSTRRKLFQYLTQHLP